MKQIDDILKDIDTLLGHFRNPNLRVSLLARIEGACHALVGQAREPDLGPWTVSEDGRQLFSDNFTNDVKLTLDGDFYGDEDRLAYSRRLAQQLNGLMKDPPPALIESMCLRYAHDFCLDKDPDAPLSSGWTSESRDALRRTMRQLYEEVSGHGFYKWK